MALLEVAEAARDRKRNGCCHRRAHGPAQGGGPCRGGARAVGSCLYVVEELPPRFGVVSLSSTAPTSTPGGRLCVEHEDGVIEIRRPNRRSSWSTSPASPRSCTGAARLGRGQRVRHALAAASDEAGADCVVYSATKHIDGQGRVLGGIILASEKFIADHIHNFLRQTGPCLSPFNAWTLLKSLETLPVRVAGQMRSAGKIADFLGQHPAVKRTLYPGRADHPQAALAQRQMEGGGTIVAFEVAGGKAAAFRVANAFTIIGISNNLGDAKSLVTHPETTEPTSGSSPSSGGASASPPAS